MKESLQGVVEPGQRGAHGMQQRCAGLGFGQQPSGQKTYQAGGVVGPVAAEAAHGIPLLCGEQARHGQSGILLRQMIENGYQAVGTARVGRDVENLEHELARIGRAQAKVAVPLPRHRADRDGQPIRLKGDALALRQAQGRRRRPQR